MTPGFRLPIYTYSAEFLKTDHVIASKAETMVETIAHLDKTYGGAKSYCKACGLLDSEIVSIRENIMVSPQLAANIM